MSTYAVKRNEKGAGFFKSHSIKSEVASHNDYARERNKEIEIIRNEFKKQHAAEYAELERVREKYDQYFKELTEYREKRNQRMLNAYISAGDNDKKYLFSFIEKQDILDCNEEDKKNKLAQYGENSYHKYRKKKIHALKLNMIKLLVAMVLILSSMAWIPSPGAFVSAIYLIAMLVGLPLIIFCNVRALRLCGGDWRYRSASVVEFICMYGVSIILTILIVAFTG